MTHEHAAEFIFDVFFKLYGFISPGMYETEIEKYVEVQIKNSPWESAVKNYFGFSGICCISTNEIAIHGLPRAQTLNEGDIVTIDIAVTDGKVFGDAAWTYILGDSGEDDLKLISTAWRTTLTASKTALHGKMIGDITRSAWDTASTYGHTIPTNCYGHGIRTRLHDHPRIPFVCTDPLYSPLNQTPMPKGDYLNIEPLVYKSIDTQVNGTQLMKGETGLKAPQERRTAQFEFSVLTPTRKKTGAIISLPGMNPYDPRLQVLPPFFHIKN